MPHMRDGGSLNGTLSNIGLRTLTASLQLDLGRLDRFAPKPTPPGAFGRLQRYKEALVAQCGNVPVNDSWSPIRGADSP
jgi:hypothetical protein